MNKSVYILSALALFLSFSALTNPDRPAEIKGEQLLKEASNAIKQYASYKVEFTLEMENPTLGSNESNKGQLLTKGDQYYMEIVGNLFISDGVVTWAYFREMNEVHVDLLENNPGNPTPTSLLNDFEEKFRAKYIKQETFRNRIVEVVDLLPTTAFVYHKVRVAIDSRTKMLAYTIAYDREGGTSKFLFDKVEANPSIPSGKFSFNPNSYPGIEVVDLR